MPRIDPKMEAKAAMLVKSKLVTTASFLQIITLLIGARRRGSHREFLIGYNAARNAANLIYDVERKISKKEGRG